MSVTTVITDGGFDMLRAAPNHRLVYTRAVCGSGYVDKTRLAALTEVQGYAMELSIVDVKPTEEAATVRLQLDNRRAVHEFQLYQIGLYAKLLDDDGEAVIGETLFQIMQYDQPDIVRKVPHVSEFVINTIFGRAEDVEGIIDLAAYVSLRQFKLTIDGLIQDIMTNTLTLPLAAVSGEALLTSSGTPLLAVYRPDKSAAVLAAVEALEERMEAADAAVRAYADSAGRKAVTQANAYTTGKALDLSGRIAAAKEEAVSAAAGDASAKVSAHNDALTAHPLFLRAAENTGLADQNPGGVFQNGDLSGPQTVPDS